MKKSSTLLSPLAGSVMVKTPQNRSVASSGIGPKATTLARIMQYARSSYSTGIPGMPLMGLN